MQAVKDYEGGRRLGSIATEHGVTARTVMYWVNNIRRKSIRLAHVRAARTNVPVEEDNSYVPGMNFGVGGRMTDREVREATLQLEAKIIALQKRSDMRTFEYRKGEV